MNRGPIGAVSLVSSDRSAMLAQALPLCSIAWGALAFGAVYPWAYWPLAAGCLLSGVAALSIASAAGITARDRALTLGLTALAGAIGLQLVPLPSAAVAAISPHALDLLRDLNPAVAAGVVTRHPLSVWPRDSVVALALYVSLALLLVGSARLFALTGVRRFVEALTIFGVLLALIGIVQKPLYSDSIYGIWTLERGRTPFGPFVNRNHFAGWMVMALPLTLALLSAGIDKGMRRLKPGWRYKVLWFSSPGRASSY